jgi:hypothetical protein
MMTRFQQIHGVRQLAAPAFIEKFNKFEFYVPSYTAISMNNLKPYFSDKARAPGHDAPDRPPGVYRQSPVWAGPYRHR